MKKLVEGGWEIKKYGSGRRENFPSSTRVATLDRYSTSE